MAKEQAARLWTPANKVTLVRILAIPLFLVAVLGDWPQYVPELPEAEAWKPIIAAAVFIAISATDALDGYLARSRNEVTNLGKFMDPLADKILVAAALLALIELQVLPSWVALIILAREFIVSGIRMVAASEGVVIAASWWGKVKTNMQIAAVVLFLVKQSPVIGGVHQNIGDGLYLLAWATMLLALFFTVASMLDYLSKASQLLGFSRKASKRRTGREVPCSTHAVDALVDIPFSKDDIEPLAREVLAQAKKEGVLLATAESCTGGMIGAALTAIPGSSEVVAGGIISYSNDVKMARLGVSPETLASYGAVSEQTACEMAAGACEQLGADVAVSATGIAGPGGAVAGKPVGTVFIGVCAEGESWAIECHFEGDRDGVRVQTVASALEVLRIVLTENPQPSILA